MIKMSCLQLVLILMLGVQSLLSMHKKSDDSLNIIRKDVRATTPYPYHQSDYGLMNQNGHLGNNQGHTYAGLNHYYNSRANCHFMMTNGVLTLNGDITEAIVNNFGKNYTINRLDSVSYKFYGVVTVITPSCTSTMLGANFCDRTYNYHNLYDGQCNTTPHHRLIWIVLLLSILLTLCYLIFRFMVVRLLSSDRDYKIVGLDGTLIRFTKVLDLKQSRSALSYVVASDKIASTDLPKKYHQFYTPKLLLIAMLFFSHPNIMVQAELTTKLDSILMSEGDIVNYDVGQVILRKSREIFPLVHEYQTADYEVDIDHDWHCFADACNSHGDCNDFGPSGKFTSDKLIKVESDVTYFSLTKRFCQKGTSGCLFTKGCNKWAVQYTILESEISAVYRMGQSVEDIDIGVADDRNLQTISSNLNNKFNSEDMTIVHHYSGLYYVCPFPPRKGTPRAGAVGDVQINKEYFGIIASDSLNCHTNGIGPPACDFTNSFSRNIPHVCKVFPTTIGSFFLNIVNGSVIATKPGNVMLHIIRPINSELKWNPDSCSINYKEIIDIDSDFYSTTLILRATLAKENTSKAFNLPCMGKKVLVPCDGNLHEYEIPSLKECIITDDSIKTVRLTNNDISYYHRKVVGASESYSDSTTWSDHFTHVLPISLSSIGFILLIITLLILIKFFTCR